MKMPSNKIRRWIYSIVLATIPILGVYGMVSEEVIPLWIALAEAVIAPALALPNVPASERPEHGS